MRHFFVLLAFLIPLAMLAQTLDAQAGAAKLKVVYHNVPVCVVSGIRIDGDHKKFEIVYVTGNVENHVYLASQTYAKQFFQRPDFYMQKLAAIESGAIPGMGPSTVINASLQNQ